MREYTGEFKAAWKRDLAAMKEGYYCPPLPNKGRIVTWDEEGAKVCSPNLTLRGIR